jgi:hypothetical protein
MKKSHKAILGTILSALCLITFMAFKSGTAEDKFIIVRSFEPTSNVLSGLLLVSDGEKTLKRIELEITREKYFESNLSKIASVLNEYKSQGYRVVSTTRSLDVFGVTTYILEKK